MTSNSLKPKSAWKGKAKATESTQDFYDLNPIITYRHILSQTLGVRDPLRVIALCDSDAFYAACEMVRLDVDSETPLVVLQWDSLIAVNYPARKYGISRMDKKKDALKRCPHLKLVHVATFKEGAKEPGYWDDVDTNTHKVSLDYYRRESMKIVAKFKEGLPGCELEKASIDEAFIDFTKPVKEILLQRYPYLAQHPEDAPDGFDTAVPPPPQISWAGLGSIIPFNPPPVDGETPASNENVKSEDTDKVADQETAGLVEGDNLEDAPTTWHDVCLSIAAELMGKVREDVRVNLGYSTSAGIARNKFLAKLTASYRKPNGQSILRNAAIPNYLKPLKFQKIRFLGGKFGEALAKEYDASTVGDLLTIDLDEMQSKFGEDSIWVFEILRGIDRNEVKNKGSAMNKSMLASKNLPKAITKPSEGQHWIRVLAAELALRLNDARQLSPNLWPKSLVLHTRKGYETGRSKQTMFPFTREVTVDTIASVGDKLWKELVGNSTTLNVTNVQLAFTGIDVAEVGQRSIEGFLKPASTKRPPQEEANAPMQNEAAGFFLADDPELLDGQTLQSLLSPYTCPRCGKILQPSRTNQSLEDQEAELAKAKMEHSDYHFAQDLAADGPSPSVISATKPATSNSKPNKRRKRSTEPNSIEKFFRK